MYSRDIYQKTNIMCIQTIEPPNHNLKQCRHILQMIALGQLILGMISILIPHHSQIFNTLMMILILYLSWAQFNWVLTSIVFLLLTGQLIFHIIELVFLIQLSGVEQHEEKQSHMSGLVMYAVFKAIFLPIAIYFVHICYKNFKHYAMDTGTGLPNLFQGIQSGESNHTQTNYKRLYEAEPSKSTQKPSKYFQGQGTVIG